MYCQTGTESVILVGSLLYLKDWRNDNLYFCALAVFNFEQQSSQPLERAAITEILTAPKRQQHCWAVQHQPGTVWGCQLECHQAVPGRDSRDVTVLAASHSSPHRKSLGCPEITAGTLMGTKLQHRPLLLMGQQLVKTGDWNKTLRINSWDALCPIAAKKLQDPGVQGTALSLLFSGPVERSLRRPEGPSVLLTQTWRQMYFASRRDWMLGFAAQSCVKYPVGIQNAEFKFSAPLTCLV